MLKKTYNYEKVRYLLGVTIPALMALILSFYFIFRYFQSNGKSFYILGVIFCIVISIDHFISLTYPKKITYSDEKIVICAFGRKHIFYWDKVEKISIRELGYTKKIYMRIGKTSFLKGRYWLNVDLYSDGAELLKYLKEQEEKIHPMLKNFNRRSTTRMNR
ncbi:hypothetical protein [Clostridium sp. DL1XJH146]